MKRNSKGQFVKGMIPWSKNKKCSQLSGKNNGKYNPDKHKIYFCSDCGLKISYKAKQNTELCSSCSHKGKLNINFGGLSENHCKNISKSCKGRPSAFKGKNHTKKTKKRISDKLKGHKGVKKQSKVVKHHIYLRQHKNDTIILTRKLHGKLHWEIYDYLYQTQGKKVIDKYLKWFEKKYNIKLKKTKRR